MAAFWVTECIPLAVTSVLPIIIFPLTGVMNTSTTCKCYMNVSLTLYDLKTDLPDFLLIHMQQVFYNKLNICDSYTRYGVDCHCMINNCNLFLYLLIEV